MYMAVNLSLQLHSHGIYQKSDLALFIQKISKDSFIVSKLNWNPARLTICEPIKQIY